MTIYLLTLIFLATLHFSLASIRQTISERFTGKTKRTSSPFLNDSIASRSAYLGAYAAYLKQCGNRNARFEELDYNADEYQSEECVKGAMDAGNKQLVIDLLNHDYRGHSYAQGIVNHAALHDDMAMLVGILKALQIKDCNYQAMAKNATGLARKSETKEYLDKFAEI